MKAMIKTIDFAGIVLDNYSVRETIMNVEKNMSDQGFHTIEEVNMDTLMQAETDEVIKDALQMAEHTVIAEAGILDAVGAGSYQRRHEIEHHDFFYELMKRIERNHKTLFVIGDSMERVEQMCERISDRYPKCDIVGMEALDECSGVTDAVINEINALAPDVVLSIIPSPQQEHFLMENRLHSHIFHPFSGVISILTNAVNHVSHPNWYSTHKNAQRRTAPLPPHTDVPCCRIH